MNNITLQQRKDNIDILIENEIFEDDRLVYSFVIDLLFNDEIDECLDYVKNHCIVNNDKNLIYYKLWYVSLLYLRGYYKKAKQIFMDIDKRNISDKIIKFYLIKLGFGKQYENFFIEETEHFIFYIHRNRYKNLDDVHHKIQRRELGYEVVCEGFFEISLERKIHYYLWDDEEIKKYFSVSQTCSCYGVIHEGDYNRDWHESTHVYNYLFGLERPEAFILEGIAVYNDGKNGAVRIRYAQAAYKALGISPNIIEWWQDAEKFRNTNSWITYTTAGYFILKLRKAYGKEKLLELAKHQTFEDALKIYGNKELLTTIKETEEEIKQIHATKC